MTHIIWSAAIVPLGRSYRDHVTSERDDGLGAEKHNNRLTFLQAVTALGGSPIRTHSSLGQFFGLIGAGYDVDDSLADGTAIIGRERGLLRVTGLYA